jgi:HlyD family secretion protein
VESGEAETFSDPSITAALKTNITYKEYMYMANGKNGKKKSRKKIIWITVGSIILLIILKTVVCGKKIPGIMVQTEKAVKRDITQLVSATGIINPVYQVVITPEVTGEIVELPVKEGDLVKKNQLLIRIKPDSYIAQRDRSKANLESAQATLGMKKIEKDFIELQAHPAALS